MHWVTSSFSVWLYPNRHFGTTQLLIQLITVWLFSISNIAMVQHLSCCTYIQKCQCGSSHLCFILNHSVLFLPHSDLGNLIFPKSSLLFQLRAPEGLDGIHGGAELALLNFNFSPQHLILTQNLRKQDQEVISQLASRNGQKLLNTDNLQNTSFSWACRSSIVLSLACLREWGTVEAMWWSPKARASPAIMPAGSIALAGMEDAMLGVLAATTPLLLPLDPYVTLCLPMVVTVPLLLGRWSLPMATSLSLRYIGPEVAYAALRDWMFSMERVLPPAPPGPPPLPPVLLVRRCPIRGDRGRRGERPDPWLQPPLPSLPPLWLASPLPTERALPYIFC